ncbi:MAG: hypothetical protein Q9227_004725 [Pyrenula ochraceoflavens]
MAPPSVQAGSSQVASQMPPVVFDMESRSISTFSHAAERQTQVTAIPKDLFRQILGLNPFKTSYFALYRPLKDFPSRLVLAIGTILAISAGVPIPIIAIIFGKLIDSFPPSEEELRTRLGQLLGVALAYFVVTWAWAITSQLTTDTEAVQIGTSEKAGIFLQSVSYFLSTFVVGFFLNPRLTGILFAAVIPAMIFVVCIGTKLVSHYSGKASKWSEKGTAKAEETMKAVQDVQALNAATYIAVEHRQLLEHAAKDGVKKSLWAALMLGCIFFFAYGANALAFWTGSRMIASGSAEGGAGTVYAIVMLVVDASCVIGQFGPYLKTFASAAAAGRNIFAVLDRPEAHINVYSKDGIQATASHMASDVSFQSVTFVYPARPAVRVLENFSATFKAGTVNGICGSNGSGKSTIVCQLLRFYDLSSGKITIGGHDIRDFNIASLRAQIAIVGQEATLFSGTSILNNVAYGLRPSNSVRAEDRERCIAACKAADAWPFIKNLPHDIDTIVGLEGGTSLSGGQAQKVCLARALVRDPSILILDEFTSALDSVSESSILQALNQDSKMSKRTTIVIAHRLATIRHAHNILVMDQGSIVESGTHESLMEESNGVYRSLAMAQNLSAVPNVLPIAEDCFQPNTKAIDDISSNDSSAEITEDTRIKNRSAIARCLELSRHDWPLIYVGLLASVLAGGIIIGEAVVFGNLISVLNTQSSSGHLVTQASKYCLIFFGLAICALVAYTVTGLCFGVVSERLNLVTKDITFRNILRQDLDWFSRPGNSVHTLLATMTTDSGHLSGLSGVVIGTICCAVTSLFGGIILAHIIAWKIAVVLLGALPVVLLAGYLRIKVLARFEHRHKTAYNAAAAIASEACAKIMVVAALGRQEGVLEQYKDAIQGPYKESIRNSVVGNLLLAFSLSITYFIYALAYWWGATLVRKGEYNILEFFIVLPALLFSAQSCGQMFSLAPEITKATQAAKNVFRLHDQKPTITCDIPIQPSETDAPKLVEKGEKKPAAIMSDRYPLIEMSLVSLIYSSRRLSPALRSLSIQFLPNSFTALVGPSGSGKSTVISLLARFVDPSVGTVYFNGTNIKSLPVSHHRQRLGLVPQEPRLLSGSIRYNIVLGLDAEEQRKADIVGICTKVGLHDFVMGLPEGYETDVGRNNGERLSGGQKQRIALARTLIRNPGTLLLDEATSQMDAHSEKQIFELLRNRKSEDGKKLTTIVVAHRLANVQFADRICVFDKGHLVERGSHDDLLERRGVSISIACWVVVFSPQIVEIFRRGSADAVSVVFVVIWLAGDVFNILGAVLQGVLPTMIILAVYYTLADLVLLGQCFYYRGFTLSDAPVKPEEGDEEAVEDDETSPLLGNGHAVRQDSPEHTILPRERRGSSRFRDSVSHLNATHLSPATPLHETSDSAKPSPAEQNLTPQTTAQAILVNLFSIILVCAAGAFGWWLGDVYSRRKHHNGHPPPTDAQPSDLEFDILGQVFGYICAVLYVGSRIPQLVLNYRRKSTEGLSLLFFLFACIGNLTYVMSIFAYSPVCRVPGRCQPGEGSTIYGRYILINTSWLIGSLGTLGLDLAIFAQFFLYKKPEKPRAQRRVVLGNGERGRNGESR